MRLSKKIMTAALWLIALPASAQNIVPCQGSNCTLPALIQFIKNLIDFGLKIIVPLAIGFIAYGAFVIMTAGGSPKRAEDGRKIVTAAVIGVAIALGSWLIITTLVKVIQGIY